MKVKTQVLLWFIHVQCYIKLTPSCQFDIISQKVYDIPRVSLSYKYHRVQREICDDFGPIRFYIHFGEAEKKVSNTLIEILERATQKISKLLHVKPVLGPLLLQRLACGSKWSYGPNKGLCSRIKSRYKGEFCQNKIDKFKIPTEHLQKLEVFNFNDSHPSYSLLAGQGVVGYDYILYVSFSFSNWCQKQDVQAYASYCRLDQFDRPIAGFINFCPNHFNKTLTYYDHYVNVAIHELFHALGFSKDLFLKYLGCPINSMNCDHKKNIILTDSFGMHRLVLPSVVQQMQEHLNCTNPDFGSPLDISSNGLYTSHWDRLLMYGSIMAPTVEIPDFTAIDPITLAVFADTGWYKVNFSAADKYHWGRGEGCKFGLDSTCHSSDNSQLCTLRQQMDSKKGCDFMHYTQTTCQHIASNRTCGVYRPNISEDCRMLSMEMGKSLYPSMCFKVQHHNEITTICSAYKCKSQFEMEVLHGNSWITCTYNGIVQQNNVTLFCPKRNFLCETRQHKDIKYLLNSSKTNSVMLWSITESFTFCFVFSLFSIFQCLN